MYAGAHYNIFVEHGSMVGAAVGNYVLKHWTKTTHAGVLPDTEYLNVVIEIPKKVGTLVLSDTRFDGRQLKSYHTQEYLFKNLLQMSPCVFAFDSKFAYFGKKMEQQFKV